MSACQPFLVKQLEAIQPEIIVTLGKHAAHTILGEKTPITRLRGKWKSYRGTKLMPTFHPAYLLRTPGDKKLVWNDLKAVMQALGMQAPKRRRVMFAFLFVAAAAASQPVAPKAEAMAGDVCQIDVHGSINPGTVATTSFSR